METPVDVAAAPDSDSLNGRRAGTAPVRRPEWAGHRPVPLTTIVGREREAAALGDLLLRPSARLVTLTGPGGVGKTRLAIEAASDLDAGFDTVAFVPLSSVGGPELVVATIARAVGLQSTDETTPTALAAYLRPRTNTPSRSRR